MEELEKIIDKYLEDAWDKNDNLPNLQVALYYEILKIINELHSTN